MLKLQQVLPTGAGKLEAGGPRPNAVGGCCSRPGKGTAAKRCARAVVPHPAMEPIRAGKVWMNRSALHRIGLGPIGPGVVM